MSTETSTGAKGVCFVVMGFGKKTDFETGRTLDLDKSYKNMIKPAAEAAGLNCVRADEIVHSGLIDVPMYEQLLNADVVVADLSTSNKNAFYELGVRHALRPSTTVIIAEDGIKSFPFDVNHVAVRQYHHLGEDIGFEEVMRFRQLLTQAIVEILNKNPRPNDSPVYTFLNRLRPPVMVSATSGAVGLTTRLMRTAESTAGEGDKGAEVSEETASARASTHSILMQQIDEAQKKGDFVVAKNLLSGVRQMMKTEAPGRPENPDIIQRLALVTYKSKYPSEEAALKEARELLAVFDPQTSNDTETLGLWGAVHKRLWNSTRDATNLDEAVRAYERGFYLRNDYYNGINLAYLLNVRAANTVNRADAVADFVLARRVRAEVLSICEKWIASNPIPDNKNLPEQTLVEHRKGMYWALATMAEAQLGLGDEATAGRSLEKAYAVATEEWMKDTTREQLEKLKPLLEQTPLAYVKMDGG